MKNSQGKNPSHKDAGGIQKAVWNWFSENGSDLPWRKNYPPYGVWVSEIMLQQTRMDTVVSYYQNWMARFPDVFALAQAPEEDILKAWEGLGYYARARNLHRAAKELVANHGGVLPKNPEALKALPGVGAYTAGAIASIGFGISAPVVDANISRVYSRLVALSEPVDKSQGRQALWQLAEKLTPKLNARDFNQGMMELGAKVCLPVHPNCEDCPLAGFCQAKATGNQEKIPIKSPKKPPAKRKALMVLSDSGNRLWVRKRPSKGLWGGLWEFPWGEDTQNNTWLKGLGDWKEAQPVGIVNHTLTHIQFEFEVFLLQSEKTGLLPPEFLLAGGTNLKKMALTGPSHKALALLEENKKNGNLSLFGVSPREAMRQSHFHVSGAAPSLDSN